VGIARAKDSRIDVIFTKNWLFIFVLKDTREVSVFQTLQREKQVPSPSGVLMSKEVPKTLLVSVEKDVGRAFWDDGDTL